MNAGAGVADTALPPSLVQAVAPWIAQTRRQAQLASPGVRLPLVVAGAVVGSVVPDFLSKIDLEPIFNKGYKLSIGEHLGAPSCVLQAPVEAATQALNLLAQCLRAHGVCGPWRNEQLAVHSAQGDRIGTVERGAVRVLGVSTQAVHLVGTAPNGHLWVQLRARSKPTHPGRWDTLMGGMVSAADTREQALARETWEEAGVHLHALKGLVHGGFVDFSRPSSEGAGMGFMRERIDWFRAQLPQGLQPINQDGEVERFELLPLASVCKRLAQGQFTPEAGLVIAQYLGL